MATDNPRAVDDQTLAPKDRLNGVVFYISALIILIFSLTTILFNDFANRTLNTVLAWVSSTFSWYYLLAATLYMVFVIFIACSRYGNIKLGPKHSKPEFSLLSWSAMLFSAGIGIDLGIRFMGRLVIVLIPLRSSGLSLVLLQPAGLG